MISAPGTGWLRARPPSRSSAGGQLEHPSEVKSSTITGTGEPAVESSTSPWEPEAAMPASTARTAAIVGVGLIAVPLYTRRRQSSVTRVDAHSTPAATGREGGMSKPLVSIARCVALASLVVIPSAAAEAQLSETAAWASHVSNEYRVVPNVTYHVASNFENRVDLYLPREADGPTPVLMYIHGGGWVGGEQGGERPAAPAVSRHGLGGRERAVSAGPRRAGAGGGRGLPLRAAVGEAERRHLQLRRLAHRGHRQLGRRAPGG